MPDPNIGDLEVQVVASFRGLMASIERRLALINRTQSIQLRVKIQDRALAMVNRKLKSFTGFNALNNSFSRSGEMIEGFFNNIGKVARRLTMLGGLIGPLTVGIGALSTAIVSLGTAAAGAALALPGLFAGMAASLVVLKTSLKETGLHVKGFTDEFTVRLQKIITTNFWDKATKGLQTLFDSAVKPLNEGFAQLSGSIGSFMGAFGTEMSKAFTPDVYKAFFGGLSGAFDILTNRFAGPFADILARLIKFSSVLFERLANGLADATIKFDNFLKKNPDFLINSWNTFVSVIKGSVGILVGLFRIFQGISKSAVAAGIGAGSFSDSLKGVADTVNGPAFQKVLTAFFRDAKAGMEGMGRAMGPLKSMLEGMAPLFGAFVKQSGEALGDTFGKLFESMNRPEVLKNISSALSLFPKIFTNMIPAIDPLVDKFSELLKFGGIVADEFSKNLAVSIQVLAPIFTALLGPLEGLTKTLGKFFREKLQEMAPQLKSVGEAFGGLIEGVQAFVEALNTPVLKFIMSLITDFIFTAVKGIFNVVGGVLKLVAGLAKILSGDWSGFADIWSGLKKLIVGMFQLFITLFAPAKIIGRFLKIGKALGPAIGKLIVKLIGIVGKGVKAMPGLLFRVLEMMLKKAGEAAADIGGAIVNGIIRGIQALIGGFFAKVYDWIVGGVKKLLGISSPSTVFAEIGAMLIQGLIDGIKSLIGLVADLFSAPIEAIKTAFSAVFDVILGAAKLMWEGIKVDFQALKSVITTGIRVVKEVVKGVWTAIKTAGKVLWEALEKYFKAWKTIITTAIRVVREVIVAVWDKIKSAGMAVWDRIKDVFNRVKDGVMTGVRALRDVVTGVWDRIKEAGSVVWTRIREAFTKMKEGLSAGVRALKSVFTGVWDGIKETFKGAINSIIGAWNGFVSHLKIPKVEIPFAPDFPGIDLGSKLQIPLLATGIRNFLGGLAIVGERGPELVKLPPGSDVFSNRESRSMLRNNGDAAAPAAANRPPIELKVVNYFPQAEPTSVTTNKTLQRGALLGIV